MVNHVEDCLHIVLEFLLVPLMLKLKEFAVYARYAIPQLLFGLCSILIVKPGFDICGQISCALLPLEEAICADGTS